ncbi:MAG: hypothetical protein HWD59_05000 [Coxiellaceae bacterium]|nr:MAG: hypothetical protein HWD59_05000 [Coxiellaceae bacterium]
MKLKVFNERFYPEALKILAFIYNWPLLALNNSIENIMKLKTELTELHPVFNDWAPEKLRLFYQVSYKTTSRELIAAIYAFI